MSTTSLTTKYRPQRFGEVAGQEAVKRILSRAAAEDRVAPAYLFSGTRGVGKTTLARVFAKALNCERGPAAEPCNECLQCRQITAGISPDVVEIDAATHGGVDEARRLKEDVGYSPLQSRYKVFIIDEAHMLSKAAFNALLKTLEEPPGRVTFILATTEPHKFPATIVSRCQHYLFKRMTQAELDAHLSGILDREGVAYEASAVALIARRGAGSVRDSMSLLGQVLALGGDGLTEADARGVLGLAGQDVFFGMVEAMAQGDCAGVLGILREVLGKGLDIGFFLRELAGAWRTMFLLRQTGLSGASLVEMAEDEAGRWLEAANRFDLTHIHANWQMTLEGQRRVMTSLEPSLALELLLLNLTCLPSLVALDKIGQARPGATGGGRPGPAPTSASGPSRGGGPGGPGPRRYGAEAPRGPVGAPTRMASPPPPAEASPPRRPEPPSGPPEDLESPPAFEDAPPSFDDEPPADARATYGEAALPPIRDGAEVMDGRAGAAVSSGPKGPPTWEGFLRYYDTARKGGLGMIHGLRQARGRFAPDLGPAGTLVVVGGNEFNREQLKSPDALRKLTQVASDYFGPGTAVSVEEPGGEARPGNGELKAYVLERPEVRRAMADFGAEVIGVVPRG
ncbi:DNA polymerase III subunit gamma/tau [Desulfolutivibrio sulfodismutans]|nr:DNA polymerase III subunit gamma/tau [Desulfolutivibrio sulfodismutans]QLA11975.1 DNA polymerase III subunit gamma/tau [Desulfolutivibrio sulfodismutans DSM 3696]